MFRRSRLDSTQLYERVRAEPREPGWAEGSEAAIMTHYSDLVSSGRVRDLRATCGSTVCELAGIIAGNGVEGINRTMREVDGTHRDLQKRWRDKALSEIGLTRQAAAFGPAPMRDGTAFATYWVRSAP